MKVILNTDIANLGEEGDIMEVSPGYARNYLLPKKLVSIHNKGNLAILESRKKKIQRHKEEKLLLAQSLKKRIDDITIEISMSSGEKGKLFGAVTSQMIVDALKEKDIVVERKKLEIPGHSLKTLGNHSIKIRLYDNEEAVLAISIIDESAPKASPAVVEDEPGKPEENKLSEPVEDKPGEPVEDKLSKPEKDEPGEPEVEDSSEPAEDEPGEPAEKP